jgi:hypothetical protein
MDDQNSNSEQNTQNEEDNSRRNFLKFGAVGAGVAVAAAAGVSIAKKMEGTPLDHFPLPINEDYVRIDQRNQINTYSFSKKLNDDHPERAKAFHGWNFYEKKKGFFIGPYRDHAEGQGQLDRALGNAGFFSPASQLGFKSTGMDAINVGVATWKQEMLVKEKYQFASKEEATLSIKSAARLFGAVRCGITPRFCTKKCHCGYGAYGL